MPGFYTITILPEARVEEFAGSRGNYYEFADGSHLDARTEPVWCSRCRRITHGEAIPTIEALDKELADVDNPVSPPKALQPPFLAKYEPPGFRENFRRERIEETRKRREWRLSRRSPPKCIDCGSTEIVLLPYGQPVTAATDPMPITIIVRCTGMCSTSFNEWFFTPEGDRIPRDTKPTYWQIPGVDPEADRLRVRRFQKRRGKAAKPKDQQNESNENR